MILSRQLQHDTLSLASQSKSVIVNDELMMFWNGLNKKNKNEQSQYCGGFCVDQQAAVSTEIRLSWILCSFTKTVRHCLSPWALSWLDNGFRWSRFADWWLVGNLWSHQSFQLQQSNDPSYPWTLAVWRLPLSNICFSTFKLLSRAIASMNFAVSHVASCLGELHKSRDSTSDYTINCQVQVIKAHSFVLSMGWVLLVIGKWWLNNLYSIPVALR